MSGKKLTFSPKPAAKAIDDWITKEPADGQPVPLPITDRSSVATVFAEPEVKIEPVKPKAAKTLRVDPAPSKEVKAVQTVRFTIDLDVDLHTQMKLVCATKRKRMADEVRRVLVKEFSKP